MGTPPKPVCGSTIGVNQDKSRLTTVGEGFAFLGFEFRKLPIQLFVHVATQESVPTYPVPGSRSGSIVS